MRSKNNGKLISVANLVSYNEEGQSPFLSRYNRQKAVTISARLVGDYTLDEALNYLLEVSKSKTLMLKLLTKEKVKNIKRQIMSSI